MRATAFEFRNRVWFFAVLYGGSFSFFLVDHVPLGVRIGNRIAAATHWHERPALYLVFGTAALVMVLASLIRTWGSAYLGRQVVHDRAVHSEALHADGPYRHVRNPLYFGNLLMALAIGVIAPAAGFVFAVIAVTVFCYRLIGREEAALESEQGESYRAFKRAVPRLFPALRPRLPAGGVTPDWGNGFASEAFFWSFALGVVGFAASLNIVFFYAGLAASPLLSWIAGVLLTKKRGTGSVLR